MIDTATIMEPGPVGTTVKDVLSLDPFSISKNGYKYASGLIEIKELNKNSIWKF